MVSHTKKSELVFTEKEQHFITGLFYNVLIIEIFSYRRLAGPQGIEFRSFFLEELRTP